MHNVADDQVNVGNPNDESSGDDAVLNDDRVNDEQSEPHSNAYDSANTSLQEEHDDFGSLFDGIETPLLSDWNFESRNKFIELQRSDRSLDKLCTFSKMEQSDNTASYFAIRNDVISGVAEIG